MKSSELTAIHDYFTSERFTELPYPVCLTTIFGEFVAVNHAFCRATGYNENEITGKNLKTLDVWADHSEQAKYLELLGKKEAICDFYAKLFHADGSTRECLLTGLVVYIENKAYIVTIGKEIDR